MMTDIIFLEFPTLSREVEAKEFIDECYAYDSAIHGTGGLDNIQSYSEWVQKTEDYHNEINVNINHAPATTYFVVRKSDNKVVGMVNIRHFLNDFLITKGYGHIGYSIRPKERRKGYATKMLALALEKCRKRNITTVHVGCDEVNIGSTRTIENNGGVLYRKLDDNGIPYLEFTIEI